MSFIKYVNNDGSIEIVLDSEKKNVISMNIDKKKLIAPNKNLIDKKNYKDNDEENTLLIFRYNDYIIRFTKDDKAELYKYIDGILLSKNKNIQFKSELYAENKNI